MKIPHTVMIPLELMKLWKLQNKVEEEDLTDRRGRVIKPPTWMNVYDITDDLNDDESFYSEGLEPVSYEVAISGENAGKWKEALEKELSVLKKNQGWSEVPWPSNKNVIEGK